jgi:hypothetical protein
MINRDTWEFHAISTIFFKLSTHFDINRFIFYFFLDTIYFIVINSGKFRLPEI